MKNPFKEPDFNKWALWVAVLAPVVSLIIFGFQGKVLESRQQTKPDVLLNINMTDWQSFGWEEKERLVASAIRYFKETQHCAISKSSGFYVKTLDALLREDPSAVSKDLFTVLTVAAIVEYDFFNGISADEQALRILGPVLFEQNKRYRNDTEKNYREAKLDKL